MSLILLTNGALRVIHDLSRFGEVSRPDFVIANVGTTIATLDKAGHVAPINKANPSSRAP